MADLISEVSWFEGCDPIIIAAFNKLAAECTPSHTTTSRRWSIWSLARRIIDPVIESYLSQYDKNWHVELFGGCGFTESIRTNSRKTEDKIRGLIRKHYKQGYVRGETLPASLDTFVCIMDFCLTRRPWKKVHKIGGLKGGSTKYLVRKQLPYHSPYCELCWRLAEYHYFREHRLAGVNWNSDFLSYRFCSVHDPRNPKSKYRTDYNYRERYHAELKRIWNIRRSPSDKEHEYFMKFEIAEIREMVYGYLHIRPTANWLKALRLRKEGFSQAEIARELGISRPAVCKLLKKNTDYFRPTSASNLPTKSSARK